MKNFVQELKWRGMIQDIMPGTEEKLMEGSTAAYVGIDQKAGLEDEETERIKRDVSNEVKAAEPRLTAVYVSSDPDTVSRLRQIANGIANGQPVSAFDQELAEIVKRISPTAR